MKEACPLCTQAIGLIYQQQLPQPIKLHVVDIASDESLQAEYGWLVPVLVRVRDDQELKWPFAEASLKEFLSA